jgi:amidase
MRARDFLLIAIASMLCFPPGCAILAQPTQPNVSGGWIATGNVFGTTFYFRFQLQQNGASVTGTIGGQKAQGTLEGNALRVLATQKDGSTAEISATVGNGSLAGSETQTDAADKSHPRVIQFTATPIPARPAGPPQRHEFAPTVFYRQYSPSNAPVLTVNPGDTIHTTTVDAGGTDEHGVRRVLGGNPETGPFFIQSAEPGDTLVVHIVRLKLNRDYAVSDDGIVESAQNSNLAVKARDNGKTIRWRLDTEKGTATPIDPSVSLAHFNVPLRPMLGCIATAVGPAQAPPGTGASGYYGGNMDFNEITEGATVYLPVSNPGALLYFGDAHALMGDGEINGNALETSMDVELTVDLISGKRLPSVRVETPGHIITMGLEGSLDDAFQSATDYMAQWLAEDYNLNPSEIAQVIGTAAEYKVSEVADRNSGVVLKLRKDLLAPLRAAETAQH